MRGDKRRTDKYRKKVRGLVLPGQKARFTQAVRGQVHVERAVKEILEQHGVSPIFNHYYMEFGKTINKLKNKFKGGTLKTEAEILQTAWAKRGLDVGVMDEIKGWATVTGLCFKLDHSLLDGPDVLC